MSESRGARFFSADYGEARGRFRAAAAARSAALHCLPLDALSPDGEALAIDVAWLGSASATRVIVHSAGLHGVEGFAGSAIQLALLEHAPRLPADGALILSHVLNPYGMAWLRRVNENNVDLNRNFLEAGERRLPAADGYRKVERLLNPASPPAFDFFHARAAAMVLRHGLKALTQAVAQGQYEYPKGIFFGGFHREQGVARYVDWLRPRLKPVARGLAIDVHTGLGRRGAESLFLHRGTGDPAGLGASLGRTVRPDGDDAGVGYRISGGHGSVFATLGRPFPFITQEFGTYAALRVLHALREENRWHHYGRGSPDHRSKAHLREVFAPVSSRWRNGVVERGVSLVRAACRHVFE